MRENWWKYAIAFALGATASVIVCKNHMQIRKVCTKAIGGAMDLRDMAMEKVEMMKESAEDLIAEADAQRKKDQPEA